MKFEDIINELQKKIYRPIYFLMGEEAYFIDEISDYIEANVLSEAEKEFNQTVIYGKDKGIDVATIISYAKRFPMMANYQVVIVKEAQHVPLLTPIMKEKDKDKEGSKNIEGIENKEQDNHKEKAKEKEKHPMEAYYENPLTSTILVLCYKYKKIDGRKSYAKAIEKKGILYLSEKLRDERIPAWIQNYLKKMGYSIHPEASAMLSEYLGSDLGKIANELEKLSINVQKGNEITGVHIEKYIGISKDYNIFELQKALGKKDTFKCFQIVNYFAANEKENPNVKVIPIIFSYFTKILLYHYTKDKSMNSISTALGIHPYFFPEYVAAAKNYNHVKTKNIISLLRKYDMKSKGVDNATIPDGELLKELVYQILN